MCDGVEDCPLGDDEDPSLCSTFYGCWPSPLSHNIPILSSLSHVLRIKPECYTVSLMALFTVDGYVRLSVLSYYRYFILVNRFLIYF